MTRPKTVPSDALRQALENLSRTSVLLIGVAVYDQLPNLVGPSSDMEMMAQLFLEDGDVALYAKERVRELENPSAQEFRDTIIDYCQSRSARGDILILYFTGHGCAIGGSSFAFCLRDARVGFEGTGILPLSVVSLDHVVQTITSYDIHPVFIIDACFSGTTAPLGYAALTSTMDVTLRSTSADAFGLLASSSPFSPSLDTPDGGAFTQALFSVVMRGLHGESGRRMPFLTLDQLAGPLQGELTEQGHPLSRLYVGRDLPLLPIARNTTFRPHPERFTPYMTALVNLLWNSASPRDVEVSQFASIGQGAYANHSKLSLQPWRLLEDVGSNAVRRLTSRGRQFARGKLTIPRVITRDPFTDEWAAFPGTDSITINDI
jgi:hypothetical protein